MKIYSNDPQDYTLEDYFFDKFNDTSLSDLTDDMIVYFMNNRHAVNSFREWWIGREIRNRNDDADDYLNDQAWGDYNT